MHRNRLSVYLFFFFCVSLTGCDEATTGETCSPDETVVCSCGDGEDEVNGTKSCNDAGNGFSSCSCDQSGEAGDEESEEESEESNEAGEDNTGEESDAGSEEGGETADEGEETPADEGEETPANEGGETSANEGGETSANEGGETSADEGGETTEEESIETSADEGGETTEEESIEAPADEGGETTEEEGGETTEEEGGETAEEEGGEAAEEEGGETAEEEGGETAEEEGGGNPADEGGEAAEEEGGETPAEEGGEEETTGGTEECASDQIPDCLGACVDSALLGDGQCDNGLLFAVNFDCKELNFDEGDCNDDPTGGGQTTGGDTQECPDEDHIVDCIGGCNPKSFIGDGACDDGPSETHFSWNSTDFNCEEFNFDEGDCDYGPLEEGESCPEGEVPDCDNYCGYPDNPGDGTCDDGTWGTNNFNCEKFNFDGGDCICPASSLIPDCNLECRAEVYLGDGQCNAGTDITAADFNCPELNFDNGDCLCDAGEVLDCYGYCHSESSLGDNICDQGGWFGDAPNFKCDEFNFDEGDCPEPETGGEGICPEGEIPDCDGACFPAESTGNGTCDEGTDITGNFNCAEFGFDEGDCEQPGTGGGDICAEEEVPDCDGACFPAESTGNGTCDDGTDITGNFNCAEFGFDGGDCGETTTGGEDICPPGSIPDCEGVCADEEYLNDGLCDDGTWGVVLNCEELNFDDGDCLP